MSALVNIGVNPDLPKDSLISALLESCTEDVLRSTREDLFIHAKEKGLAHPKDILAKRLKRSVGPSLKKKYATDIADLCYTIRNNQPVPRTLLKNGKRSAAIFVAQRDSPRCQSPQQQTNRPNIPPQSTAPVGLCGPNFPSSQCSDCHENHRAFTTLTRELGNLRHEVAQLKSDVANLRSASNCDTCCLYVRLRCTQPN